MCVRGVAVLTVDAVESVTVAKVADRRGQLLPRLLARRERRELAAGLGSPQRHERLDGRVPLLQPAQRVDAALVVADGRLKVCIFVERLASLYASAKTVVPSSLLKHPSILLSRMQENVLPVVSRSRGRCRCRGIDHVRAHRSHLLTLRYHSSFLLAYPTKA